ncbi:hypothetical protein ACM66B_006095 [Microbotryomycetes sp. NB124-2]
MSRTRTPDSLDSEANRARFETELEFVQCLANPYYLQSLAMQGLFEDQTFINYLNYLSYWHQPKFARFLQYPQCLHHLDLLTAPDELGKGFRDALKNQPLLAQNLATKQLAHWAVWRESGPSTVWKPETGADEKDAVKQDAPQGQLRP